METMQKGWALMPKETKIMILSGFYVKFGS